MQFGTVVSVSVEVADAGQCVAEARQVGRRHGAAAGGAAGGGGGGRDALSLSGRRHTLQRSSHAPPAALASRVVSVLDSGAEGPWFNSQSRRCRLAVLAKLFTPTVPLFTKQRNW